MRSLRTDNNRLGVDETQANMCKGIVELNKLKKEIAKHALQGTSIDDQFALGGLNSAHRNIILNTTTPFDYDIDCYLNNKLPNELYEVRIFNDVYSDPADAGRKVSGNTRTGPRYLSFAWDTHRRYYMNNEAPQERADALNNIRKALNPKFNNIKNIQEELEGITLEMICAVTPCKSW